MPQHINVVQQGPIVAESLKDYLTRHTDMEARLTKGASCTYLTTESAEKFGDLASIFLILFSVLFSLNAYAIPGTVSVKERQLDFVAEQSVEHVAVTEDYTWPWEVAGRTDWKLIERAAPSFGFSSKYHWFRMRIRNDSPDFSHIVASVDNTALDRVNFFAVDTRNNSLLLARYMGSGMQNDSITSIGML